MAFDGAECLLYAVSAKRDMPWSAFKAAADALLLPDPAVAPNIGRVRSLAASIGDGLGHWDILRTEGGATRICAAPPTLARLPWPGLPRAVLCGSRSPDTLTEIAAAAARPSVEIRKRRFHPFAPTRFEVTARSEALLSAFAEEIGVYYTPDPPAWRLATASCGLHEYIQTLDWSPYSDLNWPCREFDSDRLAFGPITKQPRSEPDRSRPRLLSYQHPAGWARRNRLTWGGKMTPIDSSWGRFLVIAASGKQVLRVDKRSGTVRTPRTVPLPRLLGRALTLASGESGRTEPGPVCGDHIFAGVPASIIDVVVDKLAQESVSAERLIGGQPRD